MTGTVIETVSTHVSLSLKYVGGFSWRATRLITINGFAEVDKSDHKTTV